MQNYAFFVRNNPALLEVINYALVEMGVSGKRAELEAKWLQVQCPAKGQTTDVISLHNMGGAFVIVGSIVGLVCVCACVKAGLIRLKFWGSLRDKVNEESNGVDVADISRLKLRLAEISSLAQEFVANSAHIGDSKFNAASELDLFADPTCACDTDQSRPVHERRE